MPEEGPSQNKKYQKHQLIIITAALASFMGALDSTIVNISLPNISRYFDVSLGMSSWVLMAYLLVLSSFLPAFGKLGDIKGFRRIFLSGFAIFVAGSFLCGMATSIEMLILFRVVQATGAAMLVAIGPAVVTTMLPSQIHGKALGYVGTFFSLGLALGPVVGGYLTAYLSWRWIFFVNIPIGVCGALIGMFALPSGGEKDERKERKEMPFDLAGAAFIFVALGTLVYGLNMGQKLGWTSPLILGSFLAFLVFGSAFLFRERRYPEPVVDLNLFRNRNFTYANGATLLLRAAISGAIFLLPFYLEYVKSYEVETSGLILMAFPLATMIFGPLAGMISDRIGSHKICLWTSLLSVAAFLLYSTLGGASSLQFIVFTLLLGGVAIGMFVPPNSNLIMKQSPTDKQGVASSVMMTMRNVGSVLGIALFYVAAAASLHTSKLGHDILHNVSPDQIPNFLTPAFHNAFILGVVLCLLAAAFSFMAKD